MTIQSPTATTELRRSEHISDGVVGPSSLLTVGFQFRDESDLVVTKRVVATGVESTMLLTTDYEVTHAGPGENGAVSAVDPDTDFPADGVVLWIITDGSDDTQLLNLVESGPVPSDALETKLDEFAIRLQTHDEMFNRCIKYPVSDSYELISELPSSVDRASQDYTGYDADGNVTVGGTAGAGVTYKLMINAEAMAIHPGNSNTTLTTNNSAAVIQWTTSATGVEPVYIPMGRLREIGAGTITAAKAIYTTPTGEAAKEYSWVCLISYGIEDGDDLSAPPSFITTGTGTLTAPTANDTVKETDFTSLFTGLPLSIEADTTTLFRVYRDADALGDTSVQSFQLIAVELTYVKS